MSEGIESIVPESGHRGGNVAAPRAVATPKARGVIDWQCAPFDAAHRPRSCTTSCRARAAVFVVEQNCAVPGRRSGARSALSCAPRAGDGSQHEPAIVAYCRLVPLGREVSRSPRSAAVITARGGAAHRARDAHLMRRGDRARRRRSGPASPSAHRRTVYLRALLREFGFARDRRSPTIEDGILHIEMLRPMSAHGDHRSSVRGFPRCRSLAAVACVVIARHLYPPGRAPAGRARGRPRVPSGCRSLVILAIRSCDATLHDRLRGRHRALRSRSCSSPAASLIAPGALLLWYIDRFGTGNEQAASRQDQPSSLDRPAASAAPSRCASPPRART